MSRNSRLPEAHPPEGVDPPRGIELEDHLPADGDALQVRAPSPAPPPASDAASVRSATPLARHGREVTVRWRCDGMESRVAVDDDVDVDLVDDAITAGDGVLVELAPGEGPVIIGVVARRRRTDAVVRAATVTIEAEDEVLLRAGRAALRLRADGDVELVGSRISATSRGIFRLVGRLLRLN